MTCTNPAAEKGTFTCGTKVGNPKRARWAYHACLGIQLKQRILLILLACGSSNVEKKEKQFMYFIHVHVQVKLQEKC